MFNFQGGFWVAVTVTAVRCSSVQALRVLSKGLSISYKTYLENQVVACTELWVATGTHADFGASVL